MDNRFDDLFNEFFKNNKKNSFDDIHKKMFDFLSNLNTDDNLENLIDTNIGENLGKPDKIEFYNEGDMFFEKRIWHTKNGNFVKAIITDEPTLKTPSLPEKSLQEKLDEAVKNEEFEKAAIIRDLMKKEEKSK